MNHGEIHGLVADVKWGYHCAVAVGPWTLTPHNQILTARIIRADLFKATQQPLKFVVNRPHGQTWTWPVESLQIAGDELTARVGPQA